MDKQTPKEISVCKHDQHVVLSRVEISLGTHQDCGLGISIQYSAGWWDQGSVSSTKQDGRLGTSLQCSTGWWNRDQSGSKLSTHEVREQLSKTNSYPDLPPC